MAKHKTVRRRVLPSPPNLSAVVQADASTCAAFHEILSTDSLAREALVRSLFCDFKDAEYMASNLPLQTFRRTCKLARRACDAYAEDACIQLQSNSGMTVFAINERHLPAVKILVVRGAASTDATVQKFITWMADLSQGAPRALRILRLYGLNEENEENVITREALILSGLKQSPGFKAVEEVHLEDWSGFSPDAWEALANVPALHLHLTSQYRPGPICSPLTGITKLSVSKGNFLGPDTPPLDTVFPALRYLDICVTEDQLIQISRLSLLEELHLEIINLKDADTSLNLPSGSFPRLMNLYMTSDVTCFMRTHVDILAASAATLTLLDMSFRKGANGIPPACIPPLPPFLGALRHVLFYVPNGHAWVTDAWESGLLPPTAVILYYDKTQATHLWDMVHLGASPF